MMTFQAVQTSQSKLDEDWDKHMLSKEGDVQEGTQKKWEAGFIFRRLNLKAKLKRWVGVCVEPCKGKF